MAFLQVQVNPAVYGEIERMKNKDHSTAGHEAYQAHSGIYFLLLAMGLALLLLLPWQAAWVDTHRGWFIQPMVGSGFGLGIMALFAGLRVVQILLKGGWRPSLDSMVTGLLEYRTALMSAVTFLLYIETLSILGFTLSTLIFICTLLMLSRLFNRFWFLTAVGATTALVLIFRVGLSVWMPDVWLYGLFPDGIADFANQYL